MSAVVLDFPVAAELRSDPPVAKRVPGRFSRGEYRQLLEFAAAQAAPWTVGRQVSAEGDQLIFVTPPDTPFGIARWMLESDVDCVTVSDFAEFEVVAQCADMTQVLATLAALAEDRPAPLPAPAQTGTAALQAA